MFSETASDQLSQTSGSFSQPLSFFGPECGGSCAQGCVFFQEAGSQECPPSGAAVCVSQTQMLTDWDTVTGSVHRGPNSQIFQDHGAEEMRTACVSEPVPPSQRQRWANLTDSRGNQPVSICRERLHGSNGQPGQGHTLTGKHTFLSVFPAFFPTVEKTACFEREGRADATSQWQ